MVYNNDLGPADHSTSATYLIDAELCPLTLPSALQNTPTFSFTLKASAEIDLSLDFGSNAACGFTSAITTIVPNTFTAEFQ